MRDRPLKLLVADDDEDDCLIFKEALAELEIPAALTFVHDGQQLIELLTQSGERLPHMLFLDLNMPLKSGFDCLIELRSIEKLQSLPITIFSTSMAVDKVNWLYDNGADFYISKPAEFAKLKDVIHQVMIFLESNSFPPRLRENFIITGHSNTIDA